MTDRKRLEKLIDECSRSGYSAVEDELAFGVVAVGGLLVATAGSVGWLAGFGAGVALATCWRGAGVVAVGADVREASGKGGGRPAAAAAARAWAK